MELLIRTMRDKFGERNHVLFTDESGMSNPLLVLDSIAVDQFIEMYYSEQEAMDKAMARGESK